MGCVEARAKQRLRPTDALQGSHDVQCERNEPVVIRVRQLAFRLRHLCPALARHPQLAVLYAAVQFAAATMLLMRFTESRLQCIYFGGTNPFGTPWYPRACMHRLYSSSSSTSVMS
jgi:hypothetical protein